MMGMRYLGLLALAASLASPLAAQNGGWKSFPGPGECVVEGKPAGRTMSLKRDRDGTLALTYVFTSEGLFDDRDFRFSLLKARSPAYTVTVESEPDDFSQWIPKPEIVVRLGTSEAMLDWLEQTNSGMALDYRGERIDTFQPSGLAEARRLLTACKPVAQRSKPRGNREDWFRMEAMAPHFREGRGRVSAVARLEVGTDGLVKGCTMTQSTGSAAADQVFCSQLQARGRFSPALSDRGEPEPSTYDFRATLEF